MRRVHRREEWVLAWRASARRGEVTTAQLRREVRDLEADIRAFIGSLGTTENGERRKR